MSAERTKLYWNELMEEELLVGKVLLVVDDETDLRDIVASELEYMGAKVYQAENITVARSLLDKHSIDLIVSDIRMPGGTGIDLLDSVKRQDAHKLPVILITGFADITLEEALNRGAEALLNKPFKLDDLIKTVERFTRPIEQRFHDPNMAGISPTRTLQATFNSDMQTLLTKKELALGRGGVALKLPSPPIKLEVGEVIEFDFGLPSTAGPFSLKGVGLCRWLRQAGPGKIEVGLEFLSLEESTLKALITFWKANSLLAYLPYP